jgi:hypothetical protein
MRVLVEEPQSVTLEMSLAEAGHIAADLLAKPKLAGPDAVAMAKALRDEGIFFEPTISKRMEWAGPEK